jgi:GNAT superfamily N-acetyltransferase
LPRSVAGPIGAGGMREMQVRPKQPDDEDWIGEVLVRHWGGTQSVVGGRVVDACDLPALIAGERQGLATYRIAADGKRAELITLNALTPRQGIGTALIADLTDRLAAAGVRELRVRMTNDNLDALRFYQRRGFRLVALRRGAIDKARALKPSIPLIGRYGIPVHDQFELALAIGDRGPLSGPPA